MNGLEIQLRPADLESALTRCILLRDPAFIWGPPGCGKSEIMRKLAERLGYQFIDIRMSQMDAIDLRGMPMIPNSSEWILAAVSLITKALKTFSPKQIDREIEKFKNRDPGKREMIWALPEFLPKDPRTKAIIFFDEMNHALPTNLSAAYQLIQERKLGSYSLPDGVVCMAAGNRKGDYGSDFDLPAPLTDRFTHLEIKVNVDDWIQWAIANKAHPDVIGFIKSKEEYLAQYDELGKSYTFATPRSWWRIHEHLDDTQGLDDQILHAIIAGRVGAGIATEFMTYRETTKDLPDPVKVLTGEITTMPNKRVDLLFSMALSLCYKLRQFHEAFANDELSENEYNVLANNFLKFVSENYEKKLDMLIMAVKTAIVTHKIMFDYESMPYFDEFLEKHGDSISQYIR